MRQCDKCDKPSEVLRNVDFFVSHLLLSSMRQNATHATLSHVSLNLTRKQQPSYQLKILKYLCLQHMVIQDYFQRLELNRMKTYIGKIRYEFNFPVY